jgi:hypothetical protein
LLPSPVRATIGSILQARQFIRILLGIDFNI